MNQPQRVTVTDGVTHLDSDTHVKVQAVLACVQQIFADEAWTIQVLAAAVMAEHELDHGASPEQVRKTLKDGLKSRLIEHLA